MRRRQEGDELEEERKGLIVRPLILRLMGACYSGDKPAEGALL